MADPTRNDRDIAGRLRQMIAALEIERQALAGLDPNAITEAALAKEELCDALAPTAPGALNEECIALARTAQHLNEVNRRVRNLLAANVAARLEALGQMHRRSVPAEIAHA